MTYELVIDDEKLDEVFAISLVENPAIEVDFVYFNEQVNFSAVNDEQRLVMGPLLLPNRKILRVDGAGYPYHVFFSEKTVRRLAEMFLEKKYTDKATLEHQKPIDGVKLVESWIIESREKDKSKLYNFNLPVGTWMGVMKIEDDKLWNDYVKTGKVKGFSVEALLGHNLVAASKETIMSKNVEDLNEEEAEILLAEIKALIQNEAQPSITSTYPGEAASGSYTAPALLAEPEIDIFGYGTKQFYICPGAIGTFEELKTLAKDEDTIGMIRSAAQIADNVFKIEKDAIENKSTTQREVDEATVLVSDFKDLMKEIEEEVGQTFDVSYMDGHIVTIKSFL